MWRYFVTTTRIFSLQIADKIDFTEIASPVTNKYYIGQPHGEIYGLDHSRERYENIAKLGCFSKTSILKVWSYDGCQVETRNRYSRSFIRIQWNGYVINLSFLCIGLYLTGQDILSCGFTGALFAGVISAQVCFPVRTC